MLVINKIRLKPETTGKTFESWVTEKDYVACSELASVTAFTVYRVNDPQDAGFDYFEVIHITDEAAFERDRRTSVFAQLEAGFYAMADVVETMDGGLVPPGYSSSPA